MNVSPRRPLFHRRSSSNVYRMFVWTLLLVGGLWVMYGVQRGEIAPLGRPTPTPTRAAFSFVSEGDDDFTAGDMAAAIIAYQNAIRINPDDAQTWAKLARIQAYSSTLKTTDADQRDVLHAALASINKAQALAPDDSTVAAIRSFVLDWNANSVASGDNAPDVLLQAEQEAVRARNLDTTNILALAYYVEILVDEQKLAQADENMALAIKGGQDLMDVHRIYAYLLESEGDYNAAIDQYNKAILLTPNLTFLYLRAGANYRRLAYSSTITAEQTQLYDHSLEYFAKAAKIDAQLKVLDPIPYLSISKTYSQMGEYFIAGQNVQKALDFRPTDADVYGQLGIIFQQSRNYEGAIPALKCAVRGCTPPESCEGRYGRACNADLNEAGVTVQGLPLTDSTVFYYAIYGSLMASLSRPQANQCPDAVKVLEEVRAAYSKDTTIMRIVQDSENICQSIGKPSSNSVATATPVNFGATSTTFVTPTLVPPATPTLVPQATP